MIICHKDKCTACGACYNICPVNAITMEEGDYGFVYPVIEPDKCIECKRCRTVCPNNISKQSIANKPLDIYAGWNKDSSVRFFSSSGGMATALTFYAIDQGYKVAGVQWNEKWEPEYKIADNKADCKMFQGSKYVQCNTKLIYRDIKTILDNGDKIIFFGTPCQAAALRVFLKRDYKNLYIVDFVCHGIPSYQMFKKHLAEVLNDNIDAISNIKMRYKDPEWSYGSVRIESDGKVVYSKKTIEDTYFNLFNFCYSLREVCHHCNYADSERVSDITLCDFWGYSPDSIKMMRYRNGVSGIIVNTVKGKCLFEEIKDKICYELASLDKLKRGNICLQKPFAAPRDYKDFWQDYANGMSIKALNDKYIKNPYKIPNFYRLRVIKRYLVELMNIVKRKVGGHGKNEE